MKKTAVVTIASENYFAQVQVLLKSLEKTNPKWDRFFAVVDEPDEDLFDALKETNTKLIKMDEINIPDLNDMKFRYDIMELNTAIKPFVLLKLLEKYDNVVYLDPDICVYEEMTEVNDAFDKGYHFVVIPHFSDYFEDDGKHPDEPDIMRAGVYNFGFFAADNSDEAKKAVKWWAGRLEKLCINKQEEGIFVDQKWMDLLPGRHDKVFILRNDGYNTAYWNLSHRVPSYKDGKYFFNNDRLVFFHFSGFNPKNKDILSKHQDRFSMEQLGVAKGLFEEYAKNALECNYDTWRMKKYSYNTFSDGREIKDIFRKIYREDEGLESDIRKRNPFNCSSYFYDDLDVIIPYIIKYAVETHRDAGTLFFNSSRTTWIQWLYDVLRGEYKLDEEWLSKALEYLYSIMSEYDNDVVNVDSFVRDISKKKDGVNLIGYVKSEHGMGEACRLTANALNTTELNWSIYDWEVNNPSRKEDETWNRKIKLDFDYNVSIFNINADQLPVAYDQLPKEAWDSYRIGIFYWELTEFPKEWHNAFRLLDEIWAPTKFICENLKKVSPIPVIYMPPGIYREQPSNSLNREYYSLPEKSFLFLNFFDAFSYSNRKNPKASIDAFKRAFGPEDDSVGLVLKINNVSEDDDGYLKIKNYIGDYKNIYIIAKTMTREEVNGLICSCDVSVSLHRSEGLGLLCEESMFYGKPVIATNWSGNTDFMNSECSCLVNYEMVPIGEYYGTNDSFQKWAEADVDQASEYMVKLKNDSEYYNRIANNAKNYIHSNFSPKVTGERFQNRVKEIIHNKEYWANLNMKTEHIDRNNDLLDDFHEELLCVNELWDVKETYDYSKNPIKRCFQKIVIKAIWPVLKPMLEGQKTFNSSVVRSVNKLSELKTEENIRFDKLEKTISKKRINYSVNKRNNN